MERDTGFRVPYTPGLDGIRGLALLVVMCAHYTVPLRARGGQAIPVGALVVMDLFFVLSGYLICGLLLQEWDRRGSISLRNFYARRALRIFPAMVVLLTVFTAWVALAHPQPFGVARLDLAETLRSDLYVVTGVANWVRSVDGARVAAYPQLWSLSVEMQLYVVWPLLLLLMLRRGLRRGTIVGLLVGGIVASAVIRGLLWTDAAHYPRPFFDTVSWVDAWLTGCLVAFLAWWGRLPRAGSWLRVARAGSVVGLVAMGFMAAFIDPLVDGSLFRGLLTVCALTSGLLVVTLLRDPPRAFRAVFASRPVVALGVISYGVYSWHLAAAYWLPVRSGIPLVPLTAMRVVLAFALGFASFKVVEQPFLRMKVRFGGAPLPTIGAPVSAAEPPLDGPREPGGLEG